MKPSAALLVVLAFVVALAVLAAPGAAAPQAAAGAPDGKVVFLAQKCNLCHALDKASIRRISKAEATKGPELGGVGKRRDAAWMKRWLSREELLNGKKHLLPWSGTPQEMEAVIAWLQKQES